MSLAEKSAPFDTSDLINFLKENPNIFQRHPELLELVSLTDDRGTSSLIEKQVDQLKLRLSRYQSKQSEFIEVARENEQISDSFSKVIYQLIGFNNLSEFASEFPVILRKTFEIDEVSFKTKQSTALRPSDKAVYDDALRRLVNNQSVCDDRWPSSITSLFFSDAINSAALIPMCIDTQSDAIGILALGSKNPDRYTNELGTTHLDRLGIMTGICLSRLQPAG